MIVLRGAGSAVIIQEGPGRTLHASFPLLKRTNAF